MPFTLNDYISQIYASFAGVIDVLFGYWNLLGNIVRYIDEPISTDADARKKDEKKEKSMVSRFLKRRKEKTSYSNNCMVAHKLQPTVP